MKRDEKHLSSGWGDFGVRQGPQRLSRSFALPVRFPWHMSGRASLPASPRCWTATTNTPI